MHSNWSIAHTFYASLIAMCQRWVLWTDISMETARQPKQAAHNSYDNQREIFFYIFFFFKIQVISNKLQIYVKRRRRRCLQQYLPALTDGIDKQIYLYVHWGSNNVWHSFVSSSNAAHYVILRWHWTLNFRKIVFVVACCKKKIRKLFSKIQMH